MFPTCAHCPEQRLITPYAPYPPPIYGRSCVILILASCPRREHSYPNRGGGKFHHKHLNALLGKRPRHVIIRPLQGLAPASGRDAARFQFALVSGVTVSTPKHYHNGAKPNPNYVRTSCDESGTDCAFDVQNNTLSWGAAPPRPPGRGAAALKTPVYFGRAPPKPNEGSGQQAQAPTAGCTAGASSGRAGLAAM